MSPPIARTLAALQDSGLKLRRLAQYLREGDPAEVVQALETSARSAQGDLRHLYLACLQLVIHVRPRPSLPGGPLPLPDRDWLLGDLRLAHLIGAARREHLPFTALLLRLAFAPPQPLDARMRPLHPSIEKFPLGVRRERARKPDKAAWQPLLVDSTPAVVQLLAENPRLLQIHAIQMATLRPTHPYALQALLMAQRWLTDEAVLQAVARNQDAPAWLVLGVAPLLARRTQLALTHLPWIDLDVRRVLGDWLGVQVVAEEPELPAAEAVFDVADALEAEDAATALRALLQGPPDDPAPAPEPPDDAPLPG